MNVDFHILEQTTDAASLRYTCELIEKYYLANKRVYIHAASLAEAERLDTLLWSYRDDSFLPHDLYSASNPSPPAVQIGYEQTALPSGDILVNLSPHFPNQYAQFQHIIEIVFSDPAMQQLARERYKRYREQGCHLNTHKIKAESL